MLTLGFARRLATYKRLNLLTYDQQRAIRILTGTPGVQLLLAGKAHPLDEVARTFAPDALQPEDERPRGLLARRLPRGLRPVGGEAARERLRRLGQPAAAADGGERHEWDEGELQRRAPAERPRRLVVEAYDGTNGWAILGDEDSDPAVMDARDAADFYERLEFGVLPEFYDRTDGVPHRWCERVKASIATLAPRFSASRMLDEYVERIYRSA